MAGLWGRGDGLSSIEGRMRAGRSRPSPELERAIVDRISRPARARGRGVLAVVLTAAVFGSMAAFGGVGYAFNSVTGAVDPTNSLTPAGDEYGSGACTEYVNPHGNTIPPAGQTPPGTNPKSGENPDGFYQVGSAGSDEVWVVDLGTNTYFGPYPGGTVIKYTQATGSTPSAKSIGSTNGQAGAVTVHLTGTGDFEVIPVHGGTPQTCLVPRPPK